MTDNFAYVLAMIFVCAGLSVFALLLGKGSIAFVLLSIVLMQLGRQLGWLLSRAFLYSATTPGVIVSCVVWGCLVAVLIRGLMTWQQPHWILKIIFGFALGAYVAIPNYGLVMESTIPEHAIPRHQLISNVPFLTFILASVGLAYLG